MGTRGIDTVKVKLYVFILSSVERAPARVHEQLGIAFTKRRGALSFCVTQRLSPLLLFFRSLTPPSTSSFLITAVLTNQVQHG
jgi:hypothetical protein